MMLINGVKQGFTIVSEKIKDAIKLWHVLTVAIPITISVVGWLLLNIQTTSAADKSHSDIIQQMTAVHEHFTEQQEKQSNQINELKELLKLKMDQDALNQVNNDIRANDAEQFNIKQWIKINQEDAQAAARLHVLKNEREELVIKRDCIINGIRTCQ